MRILITEGDKRLREQLQAFLLQHGHDARTASDGLECVDILRNFVPEILILDCDLLWGGYQGVIALVKETPKLSRSQIVLISELDPRHDISGTLDSMRLDWLREPFHQSDLITLMKTNNRSPRLARQIQTEPSSGSQLRGVR